LAVEIINDNGGINGRPIALIVKNDRGDPARARQVDEELVEQGVVAIIGHMTSGQTAAVIDQMNKAEVVLLSPTATSTQFSGQADYFFRVLPSTDQLGKALGAHIHSRGVRQVSGVYDLGNRAYTETMWQATQAEFSRLGGEIGPVFTFISGETELRILMNELNAAKPEAVLFISSAIDTALMAQYSRQQGLTSRLFAAAWSQTNELLEKGGQAVEEIEIISLYNGQNTYPAFQEFVDRFTERYNRQPDFAAAYAYEAVLVLVQALKQTDGEADGLSEALTVIKNLEGIQGAISLDKYGDVKRDTYIAVVNDGRFEIVKTVSAPD
jgi:branched-chain amino acid transport system substrate-binding protein